jgi:hypothetical protein
MDSGVCFILRRTSLDLAIQYSKQAFEFVIAVEKVAVSIA